MDSGRAIAKHETKLIGRGLSGERYSARVPDTLDLVDRANLAMNGLARARDPERDYQQYFYIILYARPPYMLHAGPPDLNCDAMIGESLPLMRVMTGNTTYRDQEEGLYRLLVSRLSTEDGLYWRRFTPDEPWHSFGYPGHETNEDFSDAGGDQVMLRTLVTWRELDGDDRWDYRIRALIDGMDRIAIHTPNYAYFPQSSVAGSWSYLRSGWQASAREPTGPHEGGEGDVVSYQAEGIQGLARWYAATGDEKALRFAGELANFAMDRRFWGGEPEPMGVAGNEQGHGDSHFTCRLMALRGLLEYGIVANDERAKEFVRRGYEFMREFAIPRLGYIDGFSTTTTIAGFTESCMLGMWVALGIRMSDAGLGDYWDDVDQCVRNHLVEAQLTRKDLVEKAAADGFERPPGSQWFWVNDYQRATIYPGQESTDQVIERTLGLWAGFATPTLLPRLWVMQCCSGNAPWGLYAAWEGTVRSRDGRSAQVNLLLNHASPWLDVESSLPYEGKVVIRNKTAERISVRPSSWIERRTLRCDVDGVDRQPDRIGNYLVFDDLQPGAVLTLQFPVPEQTAEYTWMARHWRSEARVRCTFRGSTLVDISPREEALGGYPIYQRDRLKTAGPAPVREVERYVSDRRVVHW
jgi:hypothetical protein